jgi:hypothetical protein
LKNHNIIIIVLFFLVFSCTNNEEKVPEVINNSLKYNIINPYYLDKIVNPPINYGSIWIEKNIKQLIINNVNIVLKGGKNPNEVYEKQVFHFNKNGNLKESEYYIYTISDKILNQFSYNYTDSKQLEKININKFFESTNQPPIFVRKTEHYDVFFKPKANKRNDSIFFYPSFEKPEIIIEKIGNFINHMEIFVEFGSPASVFMNKIQTIDSSLTSFELADKIITYTENSLPLESYHLGENWKVLELSKKWEYNKYNQPLLFKEWLHGTLIKNISIKYNENSLPKKYIFNKKNYTLIYKNIK